MWDQIPNCQRVWYQYIKDVWLKKKKTCLFNLFPLINNQQNEYGVRTCPAL